MTNSVRQRFFHLGLLLGLGVWLGAATGLAEPKTTPAVRAKPATSITARVEKLYDQGVAATERQDWTSAEKYFEEALALGKLPQIAANLGHAELRLGKAREAAEHFEQFLRDDRESPKEAREEIEGLFAQARTRTVTVYITTNVDGANVFINNEPRGKSPLTQRIFIEPGSYTFVGEKHGFKTYKNSMDLSVGSTVNVKMEMESELPMPNAPNKNSRAMMSGPLMLSFIVSSIVGSAGLGAGVGLSIAGNLKDDDIKREETSIKKTTPAGQVGCEPNSELMNGKSCDTLGGLRETKKMLDLAAVGPYILGGLGGIGATAALVIMYRPQQPLRMARAIPVVGPGYQGFVLTGSF